jgi:class 3 adenylate cyclase
MKILVADDHASGRQVIIDIITSMGHEVIEAADGPSALHQARSHLPDLVILDVEMPGLSGFEVCKQLRAEVATRRMHIIMLTGLHETEDRVRGLNLGADDYLIKPFAVRELMARVEKRLAAKHGEDGMREKQAVIRQMFERYVPSHVVERLLQDPSLVKLGGEMQEVTVLFADLQGFTRMSEHMHPEKLLGILNQYHELVVNLVQEHHGLVNKFIGDGIMALYNTPLPDSRHAAQAVGAAVAIRDALPGLHRRFEPAHRLAINFGVHTGQAVVGNVGTAQIMDFTAVGDTVNLAARLRESAQGGQILISDKTHAQLADRAEVRLVGPLQVKNRTEPVLTYEMLKWR